MDTDYIGATRASLTEWIEQLARPVGAPGGGAGSAIVLALGAATAAMAAGYAPEADGRTDVAAAAERAHRRALSAADEDAAASARLSVVFRDETTGAEQRVAILLAAAESSSAVIRVAEPLEPVVEWLAANGDPAVAADVGVAATNIAAAVRSSAINILSNVRACADAGATAEDVERLHDAHTGAIRLAERFEQVAARVIAAL